MSALTERLDAALEAFGEPILIDEVTALAIVHSISPTEARVYLDTSIVDAVGRPIRGFFVGASTAVSVGSTLVWLEVEYEVRAVRRHRVNGADLGFTLLATAAS